MLTITGLIMVFGTFLIARRSTEPRKIFSVMIAGWLGIQVAGLVLVTVFAPLLNQHGRDPHSLGRGAVAGIQIAGLSFSLIVGLWQRHGLVSRERTGIIPQPTALAAAVAGPGERSGMTNGETDLTTAR